MIKTKLKLIMLFMFLISTAAVAQEANAIIGKYRLPNKLDIKIYKYKNKFYGKIIALNGFEDGQTKDVNNSDESKQNDPLLGKIIIKGLEYDKEAKQWINGRIYPPEKTIKVNLKIKLKGENAIQAEVSKFFFWKTMEWKKIK